MELTNKEIAEKCNNCCVEVQRETQKSINASVSSHGPQKIGAFLLLAVMAVVFTTSLCGFFVLWFTNIYNAEILKQIVLANQSEAAQRWINPNPNYDTLLKVHIFNYTNIKEFLSGQHDKIHVEDVGPLVYKEHTRKVNVSFNKNFTVSFRDHRNYTFLPEKSQCNESSTFVLPNLPLLTAALRVNTMSFIKRLAALKIINSIDGEVFKTFTAEDYLWGYADSIMALDLGSGSSKFGLLMNRNGTSIDSLQVNTGEDDIRKFSIITQFNGAPEMDYWSDSNCNRIDGTDATMFPPYLLENRSELHVFLSVLCRKIPLRFENEVVIYDNIEALRYRTPLDVFAQPKDNPDNECYCRNTERCMPSGVINATGCYNGAPIYPSFPHFFSGDPILYEQFEGIRPVASLHQTYADIHPRFAFPISGASRIQINVAVHKTSLIKQKIERIKDGTILPIIWIEITSGEFTEDTVDKLYMSTVGLNAIQHALKYGSFCICIISLFLIILSVQILKKKDVVERKENIDEHESFI